ncbi:hypothetical protein M1278_01395 [Candidatus Marsarchaeota archaeon]|jgi:hypothetical protein|nr:hypothetical protein [Candidatus Marsarchaeota archaeon]
MEINKTGNNRISAHIKFIRKENKNEYFKNIENIGFDRANKLFTLSLATLSEMPKWNRPAVSFLDLKFIEKITINRKSNEIKILHMLKQNENPLIYKLLEKPSLTKIFECKEKNMNDIIIDFNKTLSKISLKPKNDANLKYI